MPRLLWLHSDGGLLIVGADYVLMEEVNVDPGLFFFFFFNPGEASLGLEVTSIQPNAKQISAFLRSVSANGAQLKTEMVDPNRQDHERKTDRDGNNKMKGGGGVKKKVLLDRK